MESTNFMTPEPSETVKYLNFHGAKLKIERGPDGFWRDDFGTVWALEEAGATTDPVSRCGVWPLALPVGWGNCDPHDYMYSCPFWQSEHTRLESDEKLITLNPGELGHVFFYAAHLFGAPFWENKATA